MSQSAHSWNAEELNDQPQNDHEKLHHRPPLKQHFIRQAEDNGSPSLVAYFGPSSPLHRKSPPKTDESKPIRSRTSRRHPEQPPSIKTTLSFYLSTVMALFAGISPLLAIVPEYTLEQGAVRLKGVGPDNPIIYDNDWWFDVFDNNYLWAQASLGKANLRGNIVSRDMWDWEKGYLYPMRKCVEDAEKALKLARDSGLKNIPALSLGSDRVLTRPDTGRIEDTVPQPTPGSRLIVAEAKKASPEKPLLLIGGGPLSTVANALLTNPEIAPNLVVFNLLVSSFNYNGKDGWSAYIVAKKTRYVDWGGGRFWDRDSVFTAQDFAVLPDNPFTEDMKRFIKTDLGRDNQLGDGAPLVWLFQTKCWTGAEVHRAEFQGRALTFTRAQPDKAGDVLVIPKARTELRQCRDEFFRIMTNPKLFP